MNSLTDASGGAAAASSEAAAAKPKRQRKSTLAALQAEYQRGFDAGMNVTPERWPGAIAAFLVAAIAFGLGAWLF